MPGSVVTFETFDCFQNQITREDQSIEELNWEKINPATGPLYVTGAEPGDTLRVEILKIDVADFGVMAAIPGAGILGDRVQSSQIKIVPIRDNQAIFNQQIELPINPMIGVIGVAPAGEGVASGIPDSHGGNMDNSRICQGATVYLPVQVPGALLAMGDLHAVMGDGEVMVSGVEIAGSVQVRVDLLKSQHLNNPLLEDSQYIYCIASDEDLLTAIKVATADLHAQIMDRLNLSFNEAGMLLSAAGDLQICQVVDPKLTVRFAFPKNLLPRF